MSTLLIELLTDLTDETSEVDGLVANLSSDLWRSPTPAAGWSIQNQMTHLAYFDDATILALTSPDEFRRQAADLVKRSSDFPNLLVREFDNLEPIEVLRWFRQSRESLLEVFAAHDASVRLPWFGPDMNLASSITARLMETWAHGTDVADALKVVRIPASRLRHIAHLGVQTRTFSYSLRGMEPSTTPVVVELVAPDGSTWRWGPEGAHDFVRGPALDFCYVVTQRRHLDDTSLEVVGLDATEWIQIAQAYAGVPGSGRWPLNSFEEH
jgi:uncharacterized protein (TIGR03084 family)